MIPLFFSPKKKLYYFRGEENCNSCKNCIENDLICNIQWRRGKEPTLNYYCLSCHLKIKDYGGEVVENFICVVSNLMPIDAFPIFPSPPTLINYRGESVFDAVFSKNSEAEIIDYTKLAGRPDSNAERVALEIKKNKEMFAQRNKELGQSHFLLKDMQLDEEKAERDSKYSNGKYKKRFEKEIPENTLDIDDFLDGVKNSKPVIDHDKKFLK